MYITFYAQGTTSLEVGCLSEGLEKQLSPKVSVGIRKNTVVGLNVKCPVGQLVVLACAG